MSRQWLEGTEAQKTEVIVPVLGIAAGKFPVQELLNYALNRVMEARIPMATRDQKYETFRALHERAGAFVIPNPWDAGTARILTALGFEALATTSAGVAFAAGRRDSPNGLTRDEILANAKAMVEATHLPVSADLENGFGHSPEACAETIRMAAKIGLAGGPQLPRTSLLWRTA